MEDQDDVADSEQREVVCAELDDNHLSGEGQVVGETVEQNDNTQCDNHIGAVVIKQKCLNHLLVRNYPFQLHALMKLSFTYSKNALFSDNCTGTVNVFGKTCAPCQMLTHTKAGQ